MACFISKLTARLDDYPEQVTFPHDYYKSQYRLYTTQRYILVIFITLDVLIVYDQE